MSRLIDAVERRPQTAFAAFLVLHAAVWKTARPLVGAVGALVAILIIDGMHYFNFTAAKFNHDVIELPFWALAGFAFHAGLRQPLFFGGVCTAARGGRSIGRFENNGFDIT